MIVLKLLFLWCRVCWRRGCGLLRSNLQRSGGSSYHFARLTKINAFKKGVLFKVRPLTSPGGGFYTPPGCALTGSRLGSVLLIFYLLELLYKCFGFACFSYLHKKNITPCNGSNNNIIYNWFQLFQVLQWFTNNILLSWSLPPGLIIIKIFFIGSRWCRFDHVNKYYIGSWSCCNDIIYNWFHWLQWFRGLWWFAVVPVGAGVGSIGGAWERGSF